MKIRDFNSTSINGLVEAIKEFQHSLNRALQHLNLEVRPKDATEKPENEVYKILVFGK